MVLFEIYFYFNYVIPIEKNEFIGKINLYLIEFESNLNLNHVQKRAILYLLESENIHNFNNTFMSDLYNQYLKSLEQQQKLLDKLLILACNMCGIIGIILLILFCFCFINRKKINWKWIFIENLLMFALLGVFEYLFFTNIILNYSPITDAEIKYFVVDNLYNYFNSTIY
jgi:hypothetical protein